MLSLGAPPDIIDAVGAVAVTLLGVAVWRHRPRTRASRLVAQFAVAYGLWSLGFNVVASDAQWDTGRRAWIVATGLLTTVAAARLALLLPRPATRADRGIVILAALVGLLGFFQFGREDLSSWRGLSDPSGAVGLVFAIVLLSLRYARLAETRERSQVAAMTAILSLQSGLATGKVVGEGWGTPMDAALSAAPIIVAATIWLVHAARAKADAAQARNVALLILSIPVAGALVGVVLGTVEGTFGVARVAMVALLAYAILRHQLLGVDVRIKWTIKQGTIAAVFVGVFFVVSELASLVLSGRMGPWLGIVAAGALLFALTPLQDAAQRLADRAMPHVVSPAAMAFDDRATTFRHMARLAWEDNAVDPSERAMLQGLRRRLGLSAEEAEAIEADVLRERVAPAR